MSTKFSLNNPITSNSSTGKTITSNTPTGSSPTNNLNTNNSPTSNPLTTHASTTHSKEKTTIGMLIELANLHQKTSNIPAKDISEDDRERMKEIRDVLLYEDMCGKLTYGDGHDLDANGRRIHPEDAGDPVAVAHKLLEEYVNIRTMALDDEVVCHESSVNADDLLEEAEIFYHAAAHFLMYASIGWIWEKKETKVA